MRWAGFLAFGALLSMTGCAYEMEEDPTVLRLGSSDDGQGPPGDQIEEFARQVETRSGGKLVIEPVWHAGGQELWDHDQAVARKVVSGELDMALVPSRTWDSEGILSLRALSAPFLVTSSAVLREAAEPELADGMLAGLDEAGLKGLTVLKTTQSGFVGFPKDRYTSLKETTDRILATDVSARWRYVPDAGSRDLDFNTIYADVKRILLEEFTRRYSAALQATLFDMGRAVLEAHPEIAEIRFSMPNKHHFVVDLEPYGLDNPNEVFFASDRSYGLIEAAVTRDGQAEVPSAWEAVSSFC